MSFLPYEESLVSIKKPEDSDGIESSGDGTYVNRGICWKMLEACFMYYIV
jgi:hypothetical protein